jgi:MerR family transcriptional regulator, heat shock protein HspR
MMQNIANDKPVYTISAAAGLLQISVHTLRMYEKEGFIIPFKKESNQRLYSQIDIDRINCIRDAINNKKISINGIKMMYSLIPCWEIINCSKKDRKKCDAYNEHSRACWSYAHLNNECGERNCRDCDVYNKYSQCHEIKELIKSSSK